MPTFPQPVTFIKHRGFFNYSELLQAIRKWYIDDDYDMLNIPMYKQKFPSATGVEHEFKMHGEKKVTEYVKFHMVIFVRVYDLRDVEIIRDGKKVKLQEGKVQVEVSPVLDLDWQKRFGGSKFLQALEEFYRKYIIKYTIVDYWEDVVLLKAAQLSKVIKESLGQEVIL